MGDRTQTNAQRNGTGSGTKETPNTEPENSRNKWVFAFFCNNKVDAQLFSCVDSAIFPEY